MRTLLLTLALVVTAWTAVEQLMLDVNAMPGLPEAERAACTSFLPTHLLRAFARVAGSAGKAPPARSTPFAPGRLSNVPGPAMSLGQQPACAIS